MKTICPHCIGTGKVIECVSDVNIKDIPNQFEEEISEIKSYAIKCKSDHEKLCAMNPRAKESYDSQLATMIIKLNERADEILK